MSNFNVKVNVFTVPQDDTFVERLKRLHLYKPDTENPHIRTVKMGMVSDPATTPRMDYENEYDQTFRLVNCHFIDQHEADGLHYDLVLIACLWELLGLTTLFVNSSLCYEIIPNGYDIKVVRYYTHEEPSLTASGLTPTEVEAYNMEVAQGFRGTTDDWKQQHATHRGYGIDQAIGMDMQEGNVTSTTASNGTLPGDDKTSSFPDPTKQSMHRDGETLYVFVNGQWVDLGKINVNDANQPPVDTDTPTDHPNGLPDDDKKEPISDTPAEADVKETPMAPTPEIHPMSIDELRQSIDTLLTLISRTIFMEECKQNEYRTQGTENLRQTPPGYTPMGRLPYTSMTLEAPMISRVLSELSFQTKYEHALLERDVVVSQEVEGNYYVYYHLPQYALVIEIDYDHQRDTPPFSML